MDRKKSGQRLAELIKNEKATRKINKQRTLTYQEIADWCGVRTYQAVQSWTTKGIPLEYVDKIAAFFKTSKQWLLFGEETMAPSTDTNIRKITGNVITRGVPNGAKSIAAPETPASAASNEEEDVLPGEVELTVNSVAHMGNGLIAISAQGARGEVFPANVDIGFGGIKMLDSILSSFRNQTVIRLGGAVKMQNGLIERANFTRLG